MRRRMPYFEKRPLLREGNFIRKRDLFLNSRFHKMQMTVKLAEANIVIIRWFPKVILCTLVQTQNHETTKNNFHTSP